MTIGGVFVVDTKAKSGSEQTNLITNTNYVSSSLRAPYKLSWAELVCIILCHLFVQNVFDCKRNPRAFEFPLWKQNV